MSGNDDDKKLAAILSGLGNARSELMLCVQVSGVGIASNLEKGSRVMAAIPNEVNTKIEDVLKFNLDLFKMVTNRPSGEGLS